MFLFFFFKQKTAYEMRISDWSSDVCSSDLSGGDISKSATQRDDIGVGQRLAREIEAHTGQGTVVQELAYLMRAGEPDAMDRMVGFAFGGLAIQLLQQGKSGRMVALRDGNYCHVQAETLLQRSEAPTSALQSLMRISY